MHRYESTLFENDCLEIAVGERARTLGDNRRKTSVPSSKHKVKFRTFSEFAFLTLKMVFTAAQLNEFFEHADHMGIPAVTRAQLATVEHIADPSDLIDQDEQTFQQIARNLSRPANGHAPYVFGASSLQRLLVMSDLVRYYASVGRSHTVANLNYMTTGRSFKLSYSLHAKKKLADNKDPPVPSRALPILQWLEAYEDHSHRAYTDKGRPFAYVIRAVEDRPFPCPPARPGKPYAAAYETLEEEMIARLTHDHELFRSDNAAVYLDIEKALRGTTYAPTIKPFTARKDGRGAFLALQQQYGGKPAYKQLINDAVEVMYKRKWKGHGSYPLANFVALHRSAFVNMQLGAVHVQHQVPTEFTRVDLLLQAIECTASDLSTHLALVRADEGVDGKMNNFEAAVAFILPFDPVALKRHGAGSNNAKRLAAEISDVSASPGVPRKVRVGPKTGVEFRYHTHDEFKSLDADAVAELEQYRQTLRDKGKTGNLPVLGQDRKGTKGKGKGKGKATAKKSHVGTKSKAWKSTVAAAVATAMAEYTAPAAAAKANIDIAALAAAITASQRKGVTIAGAISAADGTSNDDVANANVAAVTVTSPTKASPGIIRNNIAKRTLFVPDNKSTSG